MERKRSDEKHVEKMFFGSDRHREARKGKNGCFKGRFFKNFWQALWNFIIATLKAMNFSDTWINMLGFHMSSFEERHVLREVRSSS